MTLELLREQMDELNRELISLLGVRFQIAREIARVKKAEGLPMHDEEREKRIFEEILMFSCKHSLNSSMVTELFQIIIKHTKQEMEKNLSQ